ncbi:MAG TPA: hypothetical protein VL424_17130 [Pararobbsia sp.]|nr:hypothetical protein [Pararobbsia sp.]
MKLVTKHRVGATIVALLLVCTRAALADEGPGPSFSPDPKVEHMAEAYAQDAVDFSAKQFAIKLDWSDASVAEVEDILAKMHLSYATDSPRPTDDQVMSFAKAYGSYVGEVYRRNHGGEWGMVTLGGQRSPGMRTRSKTNFWPWGRAFDRITNGSEDNVADYYSTLLTK